MFNREKYTSHIRDEDRLIEMRRVLDKVEIVMKNHSLESTDFLDPYSVRLASGILNSFYDIKYLISGGYQGAERAIIHILPDYIDLDGVQLDIEALEIETNMASLNHRDFLGGILGLGINRSKLGDILIYEKSCIIVVKKEISDFIVYNLEKISNKNVSIKRVGLDSILEVEENYRETKMTLSSLRLDVFISGVYNLSRQNSENLIKSGKVKVNWEPTDKISKELEEGDMVSIKGFGRSYLYSLEGMSKKGKVKSVVRILI